MHKRLPTYRKLFQEKNPLTTLAIPSDPVISLPKKTDSNGTIDSLRENVSKTINTSFSGNILQKDSFVEFNTNLNGPRAIDLSRLIQMQRERELLNQAAVMRDRMQVISTLLNTNQRPPNLGQSNLMLPMVHSVVPNLTITQNFINFQSMDPNLSNIVRFPRFNP